MIAVIWSELSGWAARGSRQTLSMAVCGLALAGGLTGLRPEACLEGLAAAVIWVAYLAGRETWSAVPAWAWIDRAGLAAVRVVAARLLAAVAVCLVHVLAVLPLLFLAAPVWGPLGAVFLEAGLILLAGAVTSAALGLLGLHLGLGDDDFYSKILVAGWLILTAMIPWFRGVNPFFQIWRALQATAPAAVLPGAGLAMILACLTAARCRKR